MTSTFLANRYAKAFVQTSVKADKTDVWFKELKTFAQLLEKTELLQQFISNPGITLEQKKSLIKKTVESETVLALLVQLSSKNSLSLLKEIINRAQKLIDQENNVVRAHVRSASVLTESQKKQLVNSLKILYTQEIVIEEHVDSELLAGMIIRVGDTIIDNSLMSQLKSLENQLTGC